MTATTTNPAIRDAARDALSDAICWSHGWTIDQFLAVRVALAVVIETADPRALVNLVAAIAAADCEAGR